MFEDEQKLRLLSAAVKLQNIIKALDLDEEYQTMTSLFGSSANAHQDKLQAMEDANAILQATLQSEREHSRPPIYLVKSGNLLHE